MTLNKMIVMLLSSQSSYEKHSQWSDNEHDGDVCIPPPSLSFSNNRVSFVFLFVKKVLHVDLKKKKKDAGGPHKASGLSSQWHRVLPEGLGSHVHCSPLNILGREEESLKQM